MMDLHAPWAAVQRSALLGSDRTGPPEDLQNPEWDLFGAGPNAAAETGAEVRMLRAAGVLAVARQAAVGTAPLEADVPGVAAAETEPWMPAAAGFRLLGILEAHKPLLMEWLALAAHSGALLPPFSLPALLDFAATNKECRPLARRIIGQRGRWLAALNPAWRNLVGLTGDADSPAATARQERLQELKLRREADAAAAAPWLQDQWRALPGEEKLELLQVIRGNIGESDEPLLEGSLDERMAEVRLAARQLLLLLPQSAFVQRQQALADSYLTWHGGGFLKAGHFVVSLPEKANPLWKRDGIEGKARVAGLRLGDRATLLYEILCQVPPTHWQEVTGGKVDKIIAAVPEEWAELWISALERAALASGDATWGAALFWRGRAAGKANWALARMVPSAEIERLVLEGFAARAEVPDTVLLPQIAEIIQLLPDPLPREIALEGWKFFMHLSRLSVTQPAAQYLAGAKSLLTYLARQAPPEILPQVMAWRDAEPEIPYAWDVALTEQLALLQLRSDMRQEFLLS